VVTTLPALSERAGFGRQLPQISIVGSDFPLVNRFSTSEIESFWR
jgi:hypothetical protein